MAPAGERTSGDRRKAASPATGGPPLSLRLLEPPCLRSPTAQAAGRPWASRPLPSEPCSVSTPLAHCPGEGGRLPWSGTSPAPVPFPAQRWPPFANPPLAPALRQKAQRPLSELAVPAGQRGSCPLPATFRHSRSGQGARRSRLGAEGVQRGQEATEGHWLRERQTKMEHVAASGSEPG